ncbi:hypothetical protein BJX65DRAFT_52147 [Aspergillus insuetus]
MAKHSNKRNDPFIASSERLHDNYLLMREMGRQGKQPSDLEALKASEIPTGPWEREIKGGAQPLYATRAETLKRGLLSRLAGALLGDAFLVGPMWLLALERDLYFQSGPRRAACQCLDSSWHGFSARLRRFLLHR